VWGQDSSSTLYFCVERVARLEPMFKANGGGKCNLALGGKFYFHYEKILPQNRENYKLA